MYQRRHVGDQLDKIKSAMYCYVLGHDLELSNVSAISKYYFISLMKKKYMSHCNKTHLERLMV